MRIKTLSAFVANQIAAGEVIERPASVLKELLENSIDAKSKTIDIEFGHGGLAFIKVKDDGHGIYKEDLELSLKQHTTSKIFTVEDLNEISTLGFRGEALASIASVSKLTIVSKPELQEMGYEFTNKGSVLKPIAHHNGTTVIVDDLFYNVPARRKFLRSEQTEFNYIEELFKRIALSKFDIAFSLTHNSKKIKQLSACHNEIAKAKRLAMLCGARMVEQSIYVNSEQNGLCLRGWLGTPENARRHSVNQFFYVNNRMVKDKLINHAIKQAYQNFCESGKYPTYCLYLDLDKKDLDVNVHPTKHEVRFSNSRVVHAFLSKVIRDSLNNRDGIEFLDSNDYVSSINRDDYYHGHLRTEVKSRLTTKILCVIGGNKLILAEDQDKIVMIDVLASRNRLISNAFEELFIKNNFIPDKTLLMPKSIIFANNITEIMQYTKLFNQLGFRFDEIGPTEILLRSIPLPLCALKFDEKASIESLVKLFKAFKINAYLKDIYFGKSIKILISYLEEPECLNNEQALKLLEDIKLLSSKTSKAEKITFKQFDLYELQDFVYKN